MQDRIEQSACGDSDSEDERPGQAARRQPRAAPAPGGRLRRIPPGRLRGDGLGQPGLRGDRRRQFAGQRVALGPQGGGLRPQSGGLLLQARDLGPAGSRLLLPYRRPLLQTVPRLGEPRRGRAGRLGALRQCVEAGGGLREAPLQPGRLFPLLRPLRPEQIHFAPGRRELLAQGQQGLLAFLLPGQDGAQDGEVPDRGLRLDQAGRRGRALHLIEEQGQLRQLPGPGPALVFRVQGALRPDQ
ncbi:MAG TPA: hypothetical protein DD417_00755 [Elusimicrobia bacterium]|nr:hypothetical protein [Elusimicrobiota bacterium]